MKILLLSDLHVDYLKTYNKDITEVYSKGLKTFQQEGIDIILCAGDISHESEVIEETLNVLNTLLEPQKLLFVPGNHDIWVEDPSFAEEDASKKKYEIELKSLVEKTGSIYLPGNPTYLSKDIGVIGTIGWYDYSLRNKKWDELIEEKGYYYENKTFAGYQWYDAIFAKWGMSDDEVVAYLLEQLQKDFKKIKECPTKIAVMHHVPFINSVTVRDQPDWDFFNAFMGSERFGEFFLNEGFAMVIHGHTHALLKYSINQCKVFCAPIIPLEDTIYTYEELLGMRPQLIKL